MTRESIFIKKEIGEKERIITEVTGIWKIHANGYRNVLEEYYSLLEKMQELNLSFRGVRKQILQDFRKVEVFEIETESELASCLGEKDVEELRVILRIVTKAIDSYEYKTLSSTISIFRDKIYQTEYKRRRELALSGY